MKIAVVGGGVSGLVAARLLGEAHDVTLFEAGAEVGGHVATVEVQTESGPLCVDTGFIVYSEPHYPHFSRLLRELGVATRPTDMSFSVRDEPSGVELALPGLGALFAQRRNLLRPGHARLLLELLRFGRGAARLLERGDDGTLQELLGEGRLDPELAKRFLIPLAGALWSAPPETIRRFSARHVLAFLHSHGMLRLAGRPRWRTVVGGSRVYVRALLSKLRAQVRTGARVTSIAREPEQVLVRTATAPPEAFASVVLAVHSDQALAMLSDASGAEREVLGAIAFQANEVVLHTDTRLLPSNRRAWASWNYLMTADEHAPATVTYDLTRLMGLNARERYLVTLNATADIEPARVVSRQRMEHPLFTREAVAAQRRRDLISGVRRTWYCGAWWGHGFHEDGARSAIDAAVALMSVTA